MNLLSGIVKTTVENLRDSVEKLSPKESVEGAHTVLRGSVRPPEGFSKGKSEAAKTRGRSPQGLQPRVCPRNPEGALTLPRRTVLAPNKLS